MRSIYDAPDPSGDWLTREQIEARLSAHLIGLDLGGSPLRSRSKAAKTAVCEALGYPVPASFRRTRPRFAVQDLDVYTQKSRNLQIWNQNLAPDRRYALLCLNEQSVVTQVRVLLGSEIAALDRTGTLTSKYQAKYRGAVMASRALSGDTPQVRALTRRPDRVKLTRCDPSDDPERGRVLPIRALLASATGMLGSTIPSQGADQERSRGAELHLRLCLQLGYEEYSDTGAFPDIRHQVLEVKLQTAPTIDLGMVMPTSTADLAGLAHLGLRHCDVRYCVFYATPTQSGIRLDHALVCAGAWFFDHFQLFGGLTANRKLQIPLPDAFWAD